MPASGKSYAAAPGACCKTLDRLGFAVAGGVAGAGTSGVVELDVVSGGAGSDVATDADSESAAVETCASILE